MPMMDAPMMIGDQVVIERRVGVGGNRGLSPIIRADAVDISPMLVAATLGVGSVKYDKIVNECNFARTYATDTDEPAMVAKGQYAHSYEENQKLKVIKVEVVRKARYGDLVPVTAVARDGELFPADTYFEMRATSLDYLGPDLAEYAVELSNGKRVLVRTHIYWVNQDSDSFSQCPPSEKDYRDMQRIQKDHPEYFKKLSQIDFQNLPADTLSWMRQVEFEVFVAAAYNSNLTEADLAGAAVAQTTGEGPTAQITIDPTAAGHGWFIDSTPGDNSEFLPTSNPNEWIAKVGSAAYGKIDLLTVLLHEYGHVLGIEHSHDAHDFMATTLKPGVRRTLTVDQQLELMALAGYFPVPDSPSQPYGPRDPGTPLPFTRTTASRFGRLRPSFGQGKTEFDTVANPKLESPDFTDGTAWATQGEVAFEDGAATLKETSTTQTRLNQVFVVGEHDRFLSFTLAGLGMGDQSAGPDDAFEVALIDASTGAALLGGSGLSKSDAFLNLQANGNERKASAVSRVQNADGSRTYLVDLAGIAAGTVVNLSFDLIGFGKGFEATNSQVTVRDLRLGVPQTADDSVSGSEDSPIAIDALANDLNARQPGFVPVVVNSPAHGVVAVEADGSFTYVPNANWSGEDEFTYQLSDGVVDSNLATVRITVAPVNDAPTLADGSLAGQEDTAISGDVLTTATDVDGDALTAALVTGPAHGTLQLAAEGGFTYTPDADWHGEDSFTVRVNDGALDSAIATVRLTVAAVNDAPTVAPRAITLDEDTPVILDLLDGAADVDGDALSVFITTQPQHGTLTQNADGTWTYAPAANFNGSDSFTYRVNDGELDSGLATVVLTVTAVNDAPTIAPRTLTLDEDTQAVLDLLEGAADVDGDALAVEIVTPPAHGTLTQNADGSWTYVPAANFNGADFVDYRVTDGQAATPTRIDFTVRPVNDAPVVSDLSATLLEDGSLVLNLLDGAFDVDGDALTATATGALNGQLTQNADDRRESPWDGSWTYAPFANWNGEEVLSYQVSDGALASNVAMIRLTISAVNDAPEAGDDMARLVEDGQVTLAVLSNDIDVDGDAVRVLIDTPPAHGQVTVNADGTVSYVPAADWSGEDFFTYRLTDGQLDSAPATVRLIVDAVADAPTLVLTEQPGGISEVFRTGWEGIAAPTPGNGEPPLLKQDTLDGWTLVKEQTPGGQEGFELWHGNPAAVDRCLAGSAPR